VNLSLVNARVRLYGVGGWVGGGKGLHLPEVVSASGGEKFRRVVRTRYYLAEDRGNESGQKGL